VVLLVHLKWDVHVSLREKLEDLKYRPGPKLQEFVNTCKCYDMDLSPITCTLESITTAAKVTFKNIEIQMSNIQVKTRRGGNRVPTLDDFRDDILENLISYFNQRFSPESLESFKAGLEFGWIDNKLDTKEIYLWYLYLLLTWYIFIPELINIILFIQLKSEPNSEYALGF